MENDSFFSTRDLSLAATLTALGIYHTRVDFSLEGDRNNAIGYFIFDNNDELKDTETKYRQGKLLVEPKAYMASVHSLKALVMNYLKSPHTK